MKTKLTILSILLSVGVACKHEATSCDYSCKVNKALDSLPVVKPKLDSGYTSVMIGYVMKDSTGRTRDSVLNNNQYIIYNYKKVPMGVYKAEVIDTTDETSSYISGTVFINRKLIYSISVVQPLTHYGDQRIWSFTNKD